VINKLLSISMERNKPLIIIYQSSKGITQRSIQVRNIEGDKVMAFCYTKGEYRTFLIQNILSANIDFKAGVFSIQGLKKSGVDL
jgi:hypothetical protein